jgi:hypothetical protein
MATNIVSTYAPTAQGNPWQGAGAGLQGLAGLLAGVMNDPNAAAKKRGAPISIPKPIDPNTVDLGDLGSGPAPVPLTSPELPAAPIQANPFGAAPAFGLGQPRPTGLSGILPQRFPGLFPGHQAGSQFGF